MLKEIGIIHGDQEEEQLPPLKPNPLPAKLQNGTSTSLYQQVMKTYSEQSDGWKKRNLFERQWIARDFKKNTGMSIDEMLYAIKNFESSLKNPAALHSSMETLQTLASFYEHQQDQLKGFEKKPKETGRKPSNNRKLDTRH